MRQGELDERVVDATISVGDVEPSYSQSIKQSKTKQKGGSMAIQASTGKRVSPTLTICGTEIPPAGVHVPGYHVRVHSSNDGTRSSLRGSLQQMLTAIDKTPSQQKLRLFKYGVCPRPLLVEDFRITWLECDLQPLATKALKEWAGLAHHTNTSILFLPAKRGDLVLPSLVREHKKLQASKIVQLITSHDPGVRKVADLRLLEEKKRQRVQACSSCGLHKDARPPTEP